MANATATALVIPTTNAQDLTTLEAALEAEVGIASVEVPSQGYVSTLRRHVRMVASDASLANVEAIITDAITAVGACEIMPGTAIVKTADAPTIEITDDPGGTPEVVTSYSTTEAGAAASFVFTATPATGATAGSFELRTVHRFVTSFTDNGDDTATLVVDPAAGDAGVAPYGSPYTVTVRYTDEIGQVVDTDFVVTITA